MASIELDPASKRYRIRFRFNGQPFKRSIRTQDRKEARSVLGRVEETLMLIERGRLTVPDDVDPAAFILSDGKRNGSTKCKPRIRTIRELFDRYEESLLDGVKEDSTRRTEQIHLRHLRRLLKTSTVIGEVTVAVIQEDYVARRLHEKCGSKPIRPDTVKKEVATFRAIWNAAKDLQLISLESPTKGLKYPKRDEKPPFMTWAEIEQTIARGGMSDEEEKELWASLFLTKEQVQEALDHTKDHAHVPFLFPMLVFPTHTGARRSEVLRARIDDFDFATKTVRIREKKRSRSKSITFRHVPMTALLQSTMQDWFADHPGGQYVIAKDNGDRLTGDEAHHYFKQVFLRSRWTKLRGFHVFRHSFASNLAAASVDQRVIDEWMGHQTDEMRRRYRHLFPEQRRAAIDLVFGSDNGTKPDASARK